LPKRNGGGDVGGAMFATKEKEAATLAALYLPQKKWRQPLAGAALATKEMEAAIQRKENSKKAAYPGSHYKVAA
jgi:hypothetical protein